MAINYINPGWSDGVAPAINDTNLNDISDALEALATGVNTLTTQLSGYSALAAQVAQNTTDISGMKDTIIAALNVSIPTTAWIVDNVYQSDGFLYRADVTVTGVTTSYIPFVCFELPDALSGNYGPTAISAANKVKIFAKTAPSAAIVVNIVALKDMT